MTRRHIDTTIHGCTKLRVARHFPHLSNAITLEVEADEDISYELTLYGLPQLITDSLITMFSDENSTLEGKEENPAAGMTDAELLLELEEEQQDPPQEDDRVSA